MTAAQAANTRQARHEEDKRASSPMVQLIHPMERWRLGPVNSGRLKHLTGEETQGKYPRGRLVNLITEDRWGGGTLPFLYAVWCKCTNWGCSILLADSYKSIYPNHEFNFTSMVKTLGIASVPSEGIQNLVDMQQQYLPSQQIDWNCVLEQLAE